MLTRRTTALLTAALLSLPIALPQARAADPLPDGKPHKLELKNQQFLIDNQSLRLIAGEIHPGRIPFQLWEDRIKKIKALGLNTVSVYIFWNQIEPKPNDFVFTNDTDVRRFIQLCQDNGLWVVLRVGTYVCAEWEFGGYPAWILKDHSIKMRSDDPKFLALCANYVNALAKQVADLQINHGGPILMTQFENEYAKIDKYLADLRDIFVKAGFDGQLFTCDHGGSGRENVWDIENGLPGVLRGYNGIKKASAARIPVGHAVNHDMPLFTPEFYTGWFDLWGGKLARVSTEQQLADTQFLLDQPNLSFCYYVVDGGTNFGYMAGSNAGRPMQTTYDYDAPIDELGRITPKYKALRALFEKELHLPNLPPIPADPDVISIPEVKLQLGQNITFATNNVPFIKSTNVQSMEDLGQNYGFILYDKNFDNGLKGKLVLPSVRDYVWIMVDGKVVGEGMTHPPGRNGPRDSETITLTTPLDFDGAKYGNVHLQILVHNLGRTSSPFDQAHSRKGLLENPTLDGQPLTDWTIQSLPLDTDALPGGAFSGKYDPMVQANKDGPAFYSATVHLDKTGETYLDLSHFHFGLVWVNGHNLGRFWDAGAARSLYLPSVWQKVGDNQITLLELGTPPADPTLSASPKMIETAPKPFAPYWTTGQKKSLAHVAGQGDDGNGLQ